MTGRRVRLIALAPVLISLAQFGSAACARSERLPEEFAEAQTFRAPSSPAPYPEIYSFTDSRYQLNIEYPPDAKRVSVHMTHCPMSDSEGLDRHTPIISSVFRGGDCGGFSVRELEEALNPPLNPVGGRLRATDEEGDIHVDVALSAPSMMTYHRSDERIEATPGWSLRLPCPNDGCSVVTSWQWSVQWLYDGNQ